MTEEELLNIPIPNTMDVCVGLARVPFSFGMPGEPTCTKYGRGWALPGGAKTMDKDEAVRVATAMDAIMRRGGVLQ